MAVGRVQRLLAMAILVRILCALHPDPNFLVWRPELSTPANTILQVREGLQFLQLGMSPYSGSAVHVSPLLLLVFGPFQGTWANKLPHVAADIATALAFALAARFLVRKHGPGASADPWLVCALHLCNPLGVLASAAGAVSSFASLATACAWAAALRGNMPATTAALALAAYLDLHPVLLALPLCMLLYQGPHECVASRVEPLSPNKEAASSQHEHSHPPPEPAESAVGGSSAAAVAQPTPPAMGMRADTRRQALFGMTFAAWLCLWLLLLLLTSDLLLTGFPEHQCLAWAWDGSLWASPAASLRSGWAAWRSCWLAHCHGFLLSVPDYTPTIGLFWYFFTEMFSNFTAFFLFVFHSHAVVLAAPLALSLPSQPMLLVWLQLLISCLFRPYPSAGDVAFAATMAAFVWRVLQHIKVGLFLGTTFLLLVVLGPAMWRQWIIADAANANFFYSITLLFGAWQVFLVVHVLTLATGDDEGIQ